MTGLRAGRVSCEEWTRAWEVGGAAGDECAPSAGERLETATDVCLVNPSVDALPQLHSACHALTPQAKGRVERANKTLRDLIKERLSKITV
jgi:hypothetical protein